MVAPVLRQVCVIVPEVVLAVQYRMNQTIQELANQLYYEGHLQAHESNTERRLAVETERLAGWPEAIRRR